MSGIRGGFSGFGVVALLAAVLLHPQMNRGLLHQVHFNGLKPFVSLIYRTFTGSPQLIRGRFHG